MNIKSTQMKMFFTDGSNGENEAGDSFTFADAGEHVLVFTALTQLTSTGPQPTAETRIGRYNTVHDAGVSEAPSIELTDATKVGVGIRARNAIASAIAIALILD
jgi:hypothetical protein